jgi:hypothetical protein
VTPNPVTSNPSNPTDSFWENGDPTDEGWYNTRETRKNLVVWVHGIRSTNRDSWETLAPLVHNCLGDSYRCFSYYYPAQIYHSACYHEAAGILRQTLEGVSKDFENLFLIGHSTGGIIIKEVLGASPTLAGKTRLVTFIGVPHRGASLLSTFATVTIGTPVMGLACFLWLFQKFRSFAGDTKRKKFALGFFKIPWQLSFGLRTLAKLEDDFRAVAEKHHIVVHDTRGANDEAARGTGKVVYNWWGAHTSVLRVKTENDGLVRDLDRIIGITTPADKLALKLCMITADVCRQLDAGTRVREILRDPQELVSPPGLKADPRRSALDSWLGSQQAILDELRARVSNLPDFAHVVTGVAGVGKSAVLRRLASSLASDSIKDGKPLLLPIWVPLYRFHSADPYAQRLLSIPTGETPQSILLDIIFAFFEHGCRTLGFDDFNRGWLESHLQKGGVLILDGIDDLVSRFGKIFGRDGITNLVQEFAQKYRKAHIILGIRSSMLTELLETTHAHLLEVSTLSDAQIMEYLKDHPHREAILAAMRKGGDGVAQFRTPLVFFRIFDLISPETVDFSWMSRRGAVLNKTMELVVANRLGGGLSPLATLDCLAFVGHIMFSRRLAIVRVESLANDCQQALDRLQAEVSEELRSHPAFGKAIQGFQLACDPATLRQVFELSDAFVHYDGWRIEHREWEEFFEARFIAHAALFELCGEMAKRGAFTRIYFLAGDLLATEQRFAAVKITESWIGKACHFVQAHGPASPGAMILTGNLLGTIGQCECTIELGASATLFRAFLKHGAQRPPAVVVEAVALQMLGFRALRVDDPFRSAFQKLLQTEYLPGFPDIQSGIIAALKRLFQGGTIWSGGFVDFVASLYERAIARKSNEPSQSATYTLKIHAGLPEPALTDALDCITRLPSPGSPRMAGDIEYTLQENFARLPFEVLSREDKSLACVTYGLALAAGYRKHRDLLDPGVFRLVTTFLTAHPPPGSEADQLQHVIERYRPLPHLWKLWQTCCRQRESSPAQ